MQDIRVGGKYKILKKIGSGSFGEIFEGVNLENNGSIAIKLEKINTRYPQLIYESKLIKLLQGASGIPAVHWSGSEGAYHIMVLDLLGPSLEGLFNTCHRKFSIKTTLYLADQMISRIEYVHNKSFLHRDIKPDNFLIGTGIRSNLLYIIDFGLAKKYRDLKTGKHIPFREGKSLTGTARYASISTHAGFEQGRRDDLECIGYVLMYFLRGSLPWQGIDTRNRDEKYKRIFDIKSGTSLEELCKGFPEEFSIYLNYCKSLKFEDQPDYTYIKRIFKTLQVRLNYETDNLFDWVIINNSNKSKSRGASMEEKKSSGPRVSTNEAPTSKVNACSELQKDDNKGKRTCVVF